MRWLERVGRRLFFNDTATAEIYTLSLRDALPISSGSALIGTPKSSQSSSLQPPARRSYSRVRLAFEAPVTNRDRKSTSLNSSHANIPHAGLCLKKNHHNQLPSLLLHAPLPSRLLR